MAKKNYSDRVKAHSPYYLKSGEPVPGATTITALDGSSKEGLFRWHNKMGLEGVDTRKYVDEKASIGTLAHQMVTDYLRGMVVVDYTKDYPADIIDKAENSFLSFIENEKTNKLKPLLIEEALVSETLRYGGRIDIYGEREDSQLEIVDLKSGSGIYWEHEVQVIAYAELLKENGYRVDRARILNIPRTEDESFTEKIIQGWDVRFGYFKNLLSNYYLLKKK